MSRKTDKSITYVGKILEETRLSMGLTQESFAKFLGIEQGYYSQIKYGIRDGSSQYPSFAVKLNIPLEKFFPDYKFQPSIHPDKIEINPNILLVGDMKRAPTAKSMAIEDFYAAPLVEGTIAAGAGRTIPQITEDHVKSFVWLYAPKLAGRRRHNMFAVELAADAESMLPTLGPGDIVLIDRDDPTPGEQIVNHKIYAIRTSDTLDDVAIKRLYNLDGHVVICSDNSAEYPPTLAWTREPAELVVGRVIWAWRNVEEL